MQDMVFETKLPLYGVVLSACESTNEIKLLLPRFDEWGKVKGSCVVRDCFTVRLQTAFDDYGIFAGDFVHMVDEDYIVKKGDREDFYIWCRCQN